MFPLVLESAVTVAVQRPGDEKGDEEEVLVAAGIEFEPDNVIKFDVYVNTAERAAQRRSGESAGSFVNVPHMGRHTTTKLKLGLSDLIDELHAEADKSLLVTLVPRVGAPTIGGLYIELLPL